MSGKVSGAVWDLDLPHSLAWVLMAYADHADHEGRNCYPGIDLIGWKTGYSRRQVVRLTQELIARGIMKVEQPGGGRGRITVYAIDLSAAPQKAPRRREEENSDKMSPFAETVTFEGETVTFEGETVTSERETVPSPNMNRRQPLTINLNQEPNKEYDDLWARMLAYLRPLFRDSNSLYSSYVMPARGRLDGDTLIVQATSTSGADVLRERMMVLFRKAATALAGRPIAIRIVAPGEVAYESA